MSRWQAAVAAVALLVSAGVSEGVVHHRRESCGEPACGQPATAAEAAAPNWSGAWDWTCPCAMSYGYAAFAIAPPGQPDTATPPPTTGPGPGTTRPPTPPQSPPKLHVLLLVDDASKDAGAANKAGAALLEKTLRAGVAEERLGTIQTLAGAALSPDRIRSGVVALGVRPNDTVVCFYSGAVDYDESSRAYTLTPTGDGRLARADLREALLARRARLTVLLTDAPANRVLPEMLPPYRPADGSFALEKLLFRNRGIVDVHGAGFGETAFPRGGDGGLFTLGVVDELRQVKADDPGDWKTLVERVRKATDRMYVEYRRAVLSSDKVSSEDKRVYREQPHQVPVAMTPLGQLKPVAPPAARAVATRPATGEIVVHVPAGTRVYVEDRPTTQTTAERHFETAELVPGRSYTYAIRAEQERDGRSNSQTKRVTVRAGETVEVRFE